MKTHGKTTGASGAGTGDFGVRFAAIVPFTKLAAIVIDGPACKSDGVLLMLAAGRPGRQIVTIGAAVTPFAATRSVAFSRGLSLPGSVGIGV